MFKECDFAWPTQLENRIIGKSLSLHLLSVLRPILARGSDKKLTEQLQKLGSKHVAFFGGSFVLRFFL